jgi:quercetin dioxygenase-like cupin family protein
VHRPFFTDAEVHFFEIGLGKRCNLTGTHMLRTAKAVGNRIITALGARIGSHARLTPRIDPLTLPLDPDEKVGFRLYGQYRGSTNNVEFLSCHVSVLMKGHCPHPPHTHSEEEILIMLAGEADLILPQMPSSDGTRELRLRSGQFVYYPAHFPHTLRAVSAQPANYLMFKWRGTRSIRSGGLAFGHFDTADFVSTRESSTGSNFALVFEEPTTWLGKLNAHVTTLSPGAGYEPHVDEHDVAIVVLQGEVEALGRRVRPHGLIFFAAGEPHGMRNPSGQPAHYVVFEFQRRVPFLRKITDPERWKRKLNATFRSDTASAT